jgi:spore maturation protein CgeB
MPDLEAFHGRHRGETIVVCGCGESLNDFADPDEHVTIGVNDVGRRFDPTYLVVVNPRSQFSADRFRYIEQSRAKYLFTQIDLRLPQDRVVKFRLGRYGGTTFTEPGVLHYTRNSPYVALCLAVHMGAARIGIIGVDFTEGHFFGSTGTHPLAPHLHGIDAEYRRLADALARIGVQVVNLSRVSRLTAFPRAAAIAERAADLARSARTAGSRRARIFGVTYRFLSCGDVFTEGLRHAAAALDVEWADAAWDDPRLRERVAAFAPDLLFVIHGRRFVQRWRNAFSKYKSAVWLLDEPYEVDDTATFSRTFDHVFVNDSATVERHQHACYLPVCHDPAVHCPNGAERPYDVGFVGGGNPTRERLLSALAKKSLLSYVVGGPWHDPSLARLTRAPNVPAADTAQLYRSTKIVLNVFRDRHHYNRSGIAATSMNPRIHEALACGALVISEPRPEIASAVPELPVFHDEAELVSLVEHYLGSPGERAEIQAACAARLKAATYAERLRAVIAAAADRNAPQAPAIAERTAGGGELEPSGAFPEADGEWEVCGPVGCRKDGDEIELRAVLPAGPGSERGLVTTRPHGDLALSFEAWLPADGCFVAKVRQGDKADQTTDSYHLYYDSAHAYLARHHCVFRTFPLAPETWLSLQLAFSRGVLSVSEGGRVIHTVGDPLLPDGYAVLSVKRGAVRLRNIRLAPATDVRAIDGVHDEGEVLVPGDTGLQPLVSIVTTVYDRVECLAQCIRTVRRQRFTDYEHIVVSDCPPPEVVDRITSLVSSFGDGRMSYMNLPQRHNDWGIAPAAAGLRRTRGRYVSFLSDDNGYTPEHVGMLAGALDADPALGFVYSSCRYAGRLVLRHPVPAPARIDLGQPMFRRELFAAHLGDDIPFQMMAWDWALIDSLVKRGVRWKHVDVASFIFRLARYPQLMVRS